MARKSTLYQGQRERILTKDVESAASTYYKMFKPKLLAHNDKVLPKEQNRKLAQLKKTAECAPPNLYNPEDWRGMLSRTQSCQDILSQSTNSQREARSAWSRVGRESLSVTKRILDPGLIDD